MFVDKAGEHIADIMTMNRTYASIPSASSILDTSNYTFHAVTFGKDSDGFRNHAHVIYQPSSTISIKVVSYESLSVSNYHTSATAAALSYKYKLLPESPTPLQTRLETDSTLPNYTSSVSDLGHCLNSVINPALSAFSHLVGCFPASGGTPFHVSSEGGSLIFSGSLSSFYNTYSLMDKNGFLTFAPGNLSALEVYSTSSDFTKGALRVKGANFPKEVKVSLLLTSGDAGSLLLFGGLFHLGLWCLDIKQMLKDGYNPPFNFNALNNIRKYRLFAKKTFNKDLLDVENNTTGGGASSFITMFQNGIYTNSKGMIINWVIKFA